MVDKYNAWVVMKFKLIFGNIVYCQDENLLEDVFSIET